MKFLRQQIERACVAEMVELRHLLEILRNADHKRSLDVAVADLVFDERWLAASFHQLGKSRYVELSVSAQSARLLEGRDCLSAFLPDFSSIAPGEKFARSS